MPKSSTARSGSPLSRGSGSGSSASTSRLGPVLLGAAIVVVLVLVVGIVLLVGSGEDAEISRSADARIEHVHGLGVDTADGVLYAGTHYGLFQLPEQGEATRVADRVQDFMGFTVAGPNQYLASGHPGEGQDGPSSLGLIESTDGGLTWQSRSLAGEADFHALEARHGLVYGLNSLTGEFMVSADMESWETRAQIPMADFAVSPDDPDALLATTQQGLVRSDDGGRTFQSMPGVPLLQVVSWAMDGTIVGIEPDGTVHASTDDGQTWEQRGSLDEAPHALTAQSDSDIFAAVEGAILASSDGGRSFTVRYSG